MKKKPVTQEDIARKLRVSRVTVSKALRDHPDISAGMKEKVRKAAARMGYFPNFIASQLSNRKSSNIGVVIPDLENSFFAYLTDSIIDTASDCGYTTILTVSREKADVEEKNIRNLYSMRVDGLLVCISQETTDPALFRYAGKVGIPLVFFDRAIKGLGCSLVEFDDKKGMMEAVSHIAGKNYSRIGYLSGYTSLNIGKVRLSAFKSAVRSHGLGITNKWIIEGGYEIEDGFNAFRKLITAGVLPEVIIAVNDRVALGVYRAAASAGIKIPDDIGIIAYGFSETADLFNPPLAVIAQDPRDMGNRAAKLLIDEITGEKKQRTRMLITERFILKNSII